MSKLSQCNKCVIGTGIHCEHYQSYYVNQCPHFYEKVDNEVDKNFIIQLCILGGTLISWIWGDVQFLLIYIALAAFIVCTIYGMWGSLDLNDPTIENLKKSINLTNMNNIPKVIYSVYEKDNKIAVHSMYKVFIKKEMPALSDLFKAILADFFEVQNEVKERFAQLNNEMIEQNRKERVKVKGFNKK